MLLLIYGKTAYCVTLLVEAISYALKGEPKEGVYVGVISERYPCFDSHDYAYENRRY